MRGSVAMLVLLLLCEPLTTEAKRKKKRSSPSALARGASIQVELGGNEGDAVNLELTLPPARDKAGGGGVATIQTPHELMAHVSHAWESVVVPHQAGLSDAKASQVAAAAPLTADEAWHHFQAGQAGVVDSARFLIAFGIVPSLQSVTNRLHAAAARGYVEGLRTLLASPLLVDIDERAPGCGSTALIFAAAVGSVACVQLLLDAGAATEAVGNNGASALMVGAAMGHRDVVAALVTAGADVNRKHAFGGSTAMHLAAEMGRSSVITDLCEAGADVEAPKTNGGRPLHTAADSDQPAAVHALLSSPCNATTTALL